MISNIMKDNLLYLETWMAYNPKLREQLSIENTILTCKIDNQLESIDIKNFYLPEMLYNEEFRKEVANELEAEDLFQIIKIYIQTKEIEEQEKKELQKSSIIKNIEIKKEKNIEFLVITDHLGKKYRYDTEDNEKIIQIYNEMKQKKEIITLKELGSVIQNGI